MIKKEDIRTISSSIKSFLSTRSIINDNGINHEIFASYFAARYLFDIIYTCVTKGIKQYYEMDKYTFDDALGNYLCNGNNLWPDISDDLICKLDYEINSICEKEMDEKNPNFDAFDYTLTKAIKEKGMSEMAIKTLERLLELKSLYYSDYIKKYM